VHIEHTELLLFLYYKLLVSIGTLVRSPLMLMSRGVCHGWKLIRTDAFQILSFGYSCISLKSGLNGGGSLISAGNSDFAFPSHRALHRCLTYKKVQGLDLLLWLLKLGGRRCLQRVRNVSATLMTVSTWCLLTISVATGDYHWRQL
jgi:hypothetical protein